MNSQQILENMKKIEQLIQRVNRKEFVEACQYLRERIENPESFVTLVGETSSGKSSLVNGLLGKGILPIGPQPTTGTIVEIMVDPDLDAEKFYAVTTEATLVPITFEQFQELNFNLPEQYSRLRLSIPSFPNGLQGLRIYEIPGYEAIQVKYEEITKTLLSSSDMIVYVVNYRSGVNKSDAEFLEYIYELLPEDVKIYLVINRVPGSVTNLDSRINEISCSVNDLIHRDVPVYIVPSEMSVSEDAEPLPKAEKLWEDIRKEVVSPERQEALRSNFISFQQNLLDEVYRYLHHKKIATLVSDTERQQVEAALKEFVDNRNFIEAKIESSINRISHMIKELFSQSANTIVEEIETEIKIANKWTSQQECAGFVKAHLLPNLTKKQTNKINAVIEKEFYLLNDEIQSILNLAITNFEDKGILGSSEYENFVDTIRNKVSPSLNGQSLPGSVSRNGGAAGTKEVKKEPIKFGGLFSHIFSRETHIVFVRFLRKLGAASTRATTAAVVLVEASFYFYEVAVWQSKLGKLVKESVKVWQEKSIEAMGKDLIELESYINNEIQAVFKAYELSFPFDQKSMNVGNLCEIEEQLKMVQDLLNELGNTFIRT
ncbi:dynamin family protein [Neobacillus sp. LXY-4]|uniref:dynamin family protein n=1 Tax=Neobacillus sp. LXY-4 TaxID=3379826 RepID=UPI003EE0CE34